MLIREPSSTLGVEGRHQYPLPAASLWPVVVSLGLLAAAATVAFGPLARVLHEQWTDVATYSHGYLLAGLAVWLAHRRWVENPPAQLGPSWLYLPAVGMAAALLVLMHLLFLNAPRLFLLPPLVIAVTGLVFGHAAAMRVLWPALLMYCALPVWAGVNAGLQSLTTSAVSGALALSGVPAFIQRNIISLPAGTFEVAEECSGLRYLVVGVTIAWLFGFAFLQDWRKRMLLIAAGAGLMIVMNWVRVYVIVVAGHLTDMRHYLVSVEHVTFGWVLFAVALCPLVWFARRLSLPADVPNPRPANRRPAVRRLPMIGAAIAATLLLGVTRIAAFDAVPEAADVPAAVAEPVWQPVFRNARESRSTDASAQPPVDVYQAVYLRQDADHRLIRFGNGFAPHGWRGVGERAVSVPIRDASLPLIEMEGYLGAERRLVLAWFWVAGAPATGTLEAKLLELKGLLVGRRDAAAIALSAVCDVDCDAARGRLIGYLRDNMDRLTIR